MASELITHSRTDSFKKCRKQHWFAYEKRIRRETDSKPLRMGISHHDAMEAIGDGLGLDEACNRVYQNYANMPEGFDALEWGYELETVLRLVCAHVWRWEGVPLKTLQAEMEFKLPLVNPETGRKTTAFQLAGKIDGIVELEDLTGFCVWSSGSPKNSTPIRRCGSGCTSTTRLACTSSPPGGSATRWKAFSTT